MSMYSHAFIKNVFSPVSKSHENGGGDGGGFGGGGFGGGDDGNGMRQMLQ